MRKDYIPTKRPGETETEFVRNFWTAVWEREGGPKGQLNRIRQMEEYRVIAPYLKRLEKGARILDGGCGLGDWVLYLAQCGYSVVGMDLSAATVEQLHARFPGAEFVTGDVRQTGFQDNAFDAYYSWGVFEHFESGLQNCMTEALRILKPGGCLFVSVPLDNLRHSIRDVFRGYAPLETPLRFYQWRFTRAELAREMTIGGFEVRGVHPIHKRHGLLRALHHEFGMPYEWKLTKALSVLLAPLVPASFVGHMVLAVGRKPAVRLTEAPRG